MPSFIADGYEFHAGIYPVDKVHDGIELYYRPVTPSEKAEFIHEMNRVDGVKAASVIAKWLVKKIQKWEAIEVNGKREPLPPITEKLLTVGDGKMTINPVLLTSIINIVMWGEPADFTNDETLEAAEKN